jgi:acyl-CoA reductase-like NAD-dependent aldehyde dehydrogenase
VASLPILFLNLPILNKVSQVEEDEFLFVSDTFAAANWAIFGITWNTGQDCTAGSRLYVQDTIYDKFVDSLVTKARQFVVGPGMQEDAAGGPLVSKGQYDRVTGYIATGKQEGATVACGGEKWNGKGYFVEPTSEFEYYSPTAQTEDALLNQSLPT